MYYMSIKAFIVVLFDTICYNLGIILKDSSFVAVI